MDWLHVGNSSCYSYISDHHYTRCYLQLKSSVWIQKKMLYVLWMMTAFSIGVRYTWEFNCGYKQEKHSVFVNLSQYHTSNLHTYDIRKVGCSTIELFENSRKRSPTGPRSSCKLIILVSHVFECLWMRCGNCGMPNTCWWRSNRDQQHTCSVRIRTHSHMTYSVRCVHIWCLVLFRRNSFAQSTHHHICMFEHR